MDGHWCGGAIKIKWFRWFGTANAGISVFGNRPHNSSSQTVQRTRHPQRPLVEHMGIDSTHILNLPLYVMLPWFEAVCYNFLLQSQSDCVWCSNRTEPYYTVRSRIKMTFPRPLSDQERVLVRWMLQHGEPGAQEFLPQLDDAVVSGVCGCGCASVDFQIGDRHQDRKIGMTILSDYLYGPESLPFGAFVFAHGDILGGLEVYGFGETADRLPAPEELRPMEKSTANKTLHPTAGNTPVWIRASFPAVDELDVIPWNWSRINLYGGSCSQFFCILDWLLCTGFLLLASQNYHPTDRIQLAKTITQVSLFRNIEKVRFGSFRISRLVKLRNSTCCCDFFTGTLLGNGSQIRLQKLSTKIRMWWSG